MKRIYIAVVEKEFDYYRVTFPSFAMKQEGYQLEVYGKTFEELQEHATELLQNHIINMSFKNKEIPYEDFTMVFNRTGFKMTCKDMPDLNWVNAIILIGVDVP